jgi:hypothetical protein
MHMHSMPNILFILQGRVDKKLSRLLGSYKNKDYVTLVSGELLLVIAPQPEIQFNKISFFK